MLIRALDAKRHRVASAEAKRCEAGFCAAVFHCIEKRREHAGSARANWMTKRDRTTVDVHSLPVPTELFAVRECLRRERLIRFDEIVLVDLLPGLLHEISHGANRGEEKIFRSSCAGRVTRYASKNLEIVILGVLLRHDDECCGPVIQARRIARSDAEIFVLAVLSRKRGTQLRER